MRRTFFWFVYEITFFKLSRLYCEQVTDNRPFAASHSRGTKPPCWRPLGHGKKKASIILNDILLCLSCPSAMFALQHGDFVPREWQAAKGPIDCLLTMFLRVCSVTETNILEGIRCLRLLCIKKIVLSFRMSFFVMKAHVKNSYIRKIHKQRSINCEKL